jgi:hypothetical protein
MWRRFRQWLDTLRQDGQRAEAPAGGVPDQQGCGFRKKISPEYWELVQSGKPIPTANVQAPHLDAVLTAAERVEREIARLKGEQFMRWVMSSYTQGVETTYSQQEIGGWEQLTPAQRRDVLRIFVDWRGIDSFDRLQRIAREYYGPPPWERLGILEKEWQPEQQDVPEIEFCEAVLFRMISRLAEDKGYGYASESEGSSSEGESVAGSDLRVMRSQYLAAYPGRQARHAGLHPYRGSRS